ncbi:hypothetical protein ABLO27_07455 [Roseibium sp. SCPC15]|uniref:hypothetical protein n=1 Tax=Roseibium sp. SCP15 TaxID=3141376 RepID=UPI0033377E5E
MFSRLKVKQLHLILCAFLQVPLVFSVTSDVFASGKNQLDTHIEAIEAMVPRIEGLNTSCENDRSCGEKPVCESRMHVLRDVINLDRLLDQYVQTLNAEDAALSRGIDDAIANSDLHAAALEGARIASSITHTTDQLLGAVTELNGIASFALSPDLSNPDAVWELLKDANSIINRIADATYGIDQHIESVRYVNVPDDQKHKLIDLKKGYENAFIAWTGGQLGTSKSFEKALDRHKSNLSDAVNLMRTAMAEVAKADSADEVFNEIASYRKNVLRDTPQHLKATVQKSLDAAQVTATKLSKESQLASKRAAQLATAQIVARVVQTYYSEPYLKEFRKKVQHLRDLAARSGDRHLALIEERDLVRKRARQAAQLKDRLNSLSSGLRQCAFESCRENFASLDMLQLPEIPSRNGNLMYAQAQKRLRPTLAAVTRSLSTNLTGGSVDPVFSEGEKTVSIDTSSSGFEALCSKCRIFAGEANALVARIALGEARRDALKVSGDELAQLKIARRAALKEAEELQDQYNAQNSSGLFGSWAKVTEDHQTDLSELGSQIRRLTTRTRTLGDEIERIEQMHAKFDELDRQISQDRQKFNEVLGRLDDCNLNMCSRQSTDAGSGADTQPTTQSDNHEDCAEPDTNQSAKTLVIDVVVGTDQEIADPGSATTGSGSDTTIPVPDEAEEYVLVKVKEPVTIPYWCTKKETGSKLVKCQLQVSSTVVECWVPKSVAAKGVKSCTEARKIYKDRNGG